MSELLRSLFTMYLLSQFSAMVGALVVWVAVRRDHSVPAPPVEPADVFDGIEEETAQNPVIRLELAQWFTADTEPLKPVEAPKPPPSVLESLSLASAVSHRRTVSWPVPAPDELKDDTTRPIRVNRPWSRTSYLHDEGQHRTPDPDAVIRAAGWTAEPPQVTEARLDWSSHPTEEMDGVR
jgi:hypothetical protein